MEVAYVSVIPIVDLLRLLCKSNVEALRKCATDGELLASANAVSLPFIYLAAQTHSIITILSLHASLQSSGSSPPSEVGA